MTACDLISKSCRINVKVKLYQIKEGLNPVSLSLSLSLYFCLCVRARASTHAYRDKSVNLRCRFSAPATLFRQTVSLWHLHWLTRLVWLASKPPGSTVLCLPRSVTTNVCHHSRLFRRLRGTKLSSSRWQGMLSELLPQLQTGMFLREEWGLFKHSSIKESYLVRLCDNSDRHGCCYTYRSPRLARSHQNLPLELPEGAQPCHLVILDF